MENTGVERRRIWFSGRVQGVGFRYTTRELARGYDVAGTVRNLDDGRVEAVVEGTGAEIDRLVAAIHDRFGGFILDTTGETLPASGDLQGFDILR